MGVYVKEKNNVIYVEPNYIDSVDMYGRDGITNFEVAPPLEDYSIFVNLEVEKRGRTIQSNSSSNSDTLVLSWVDKGNGKGNVNFMQGSKIPLKDGGYLHSLTTNYTDIHISDLKSTRGNVEMFGISSIDIAYNNYMVPEVTMKFVDVRGASLFAAKELAASNKGHDTAVSDVDDNDIATQFFECFFTFPYPKFTLTVKGFYGHPVSYELTLADFRASFESSTGNFSCTAKFVGFYFSFLNDIMINDMFAAPYSDYIGADYWKSANFKIRGVNDEEIDMPKIGDIIKRVNSGMTNATKYERSNPLLFEKEKIETKRDKLRELKNYYNNYARSVETFCLKMENRDGARMFFNDSDNDGFVSNGVVFSPQDRNEYFSGYSSDYEGRINGTYSTLKKEIDAYNAKNNPTLPYPVNLASEMPMKRVVETTSDGKAHLMNNLWCDKIKKENTNLYEVVNTELEKANNVYDKSPYYDMSSVYFYTDNGFSKQVSSMLNEIETREGEITEELGSKIDDNVLEALGFKPTVENMTKIIMAHFETFMYMLYKTGEIISDSKRTIDMLGASDNEDFTDVPSRMLPIVPPFPKVTKKEYDANNKTWKRIETWIGNFRGDFREEDLIHGIMNGVSTVNKAIDESGSSGSGVDFSYEIDTKYPLTPSDFITSDSIYGSFSENDVSDILGLIAVRAIHILGVSKFKNVQEYAMALGRAEAKNFLASNTISQTLKAKLSSLTSDGINDILNGKQNGIIPKPSYGFWAWQNNASDSSRERFIEPDGTFRLFDYNNGTLSTIPYKNLSWETIREEVYNGGGNAAVYSDNYINTSSLQSVPKNNVFYVDLEYGKYAQIIRDTLRNFTGLEDFTSNIEEGCVYDTEKYVKLIESDADTLVVHNIDNFLDVKSYEKSCIIPRSEDYVPGMKIFGRGFNMNDFHDWDIDGEWVNSNGEKVVRSGKNGIETYLNNPESNDITICEFPGVKLEAGTGSFCGQRMVFSTTKKVSLFGNKFYYMQNKVETRALLFLISVNSIFNTKLIFEKIVNDENQMQILPLSSILLFGGLLWINSDYTTKSESIVGVENKNGLLFNLDNGFDLSNYIPKLREDAKSKLINMFLDWVYTPFGNIKSFTEIRDQLELDFTRKTSEKFFEILDETEEVKWIGLGRSWYKIEGEDGKRYETLADFFRGELSDTFFDSYITIDEDVKYKGELWHGMRLGNRDTCREMIDARDIALKPCMFIKTSTVNKPSSTYPKLSTGVLRNFFNGFLNVINENEDDEKNTDKISQAKDVNTVEEIKLGIYRYCKLVYDKWVGGLTEAKFNKEWTFNKFFKENKYFYFIDGYYNDIGNDVIINVSEFCDAVKDCWMNKNQSLLQLLSTMYSQNKMLLICLQNFLDLSDTASMREMFKPLPYTDYWSVKTTPNFVVIHPYEPSSHLDIEGAEYKNDGFLLSDFDNSNEWPEPLRTKSSMSENGCRLPAFGVNYGKMYQSYFTDIDVSMDNPTVTEQSINAMYKIASSFNEGDDSDPRSTSYTLGQDLFTIYSNNSYTCNVNMMGCAWVQPLMYFVLNNVPMFRGTYLIEKVTHHIEPGNMTTKFMGVRMAKTASALVKNVSVRGVADNHDIGYSGDEFIGEQNRNASVDNNCSYKVFPLSPSGFDSIEEISATNSIKQNKKLLMEAMIKMGYSKYAAAAVAGNVMGECTFRQDEINGMKKATKESNGMKGGMCQWQGPRITRLITGDMNANVNTETIVPMPSYGKQIIFMDYELRNNYKSVYKQLMATNSADMVSESAAYFFNNFERGSAEHEIERRRYAIEALAEYENNSTSVTIPKIEKNNDSHVSEYATMLLDALNKSIAYTSSDLVVGVDSSRSNGDTIYLTKGSGNGDGLSLAFDVLMNAYYDNFSEIKWVTDENSLPSEPSALIVTAKKNPSKRKISVVSNNSTSKTINLNGDILNVDGGMNKNFSKTLVKVYKTMDNPKLLEEVPSLNGTNMEKTFETNKIEDCPIYNAESVSSDPACESVSPNIRTSDALNESLYVEKLHCWQKNICKVKNVARQSYGGCGYCTGVINRALQNVGLGRYTNNSVYPMDLYNNLRTMGGWSEVLSGNTSHKSEIIPPSFKPEIGDICMMWYYNNSTYKSSTFRKIHTCSWDGKQWVSDFMQNNCNVYMSRDGNWNLTWHVMRYNNKTKS